MQQAQIFCRLEPNTKFKGVGTTVVISSRPKYRYDKQRAEDMSAHSPAPASDHSMATFLRQRYARKPEKKEALPRDLFPKPKPGPDSTSCVCEGH